MLLAEYNHTPWNVEGGQLTLEELYKNWLNIKKNTLSLANYKHLTSAWHHIEALKEIKYVKIKQFQKQATIDNCGFGYATQSAVKTLWRHLENLANELEITSSATAQYLTVATATNIRQRAIFTDAEVKQLWQVENEQFIDIILFMLYTGYRIGEVLQITLADIDRKEWTIKGGLKTKAGKNRIVPIHSKILPLVERRIGESKQGYLFEFIGAKIKEDTFRKHWAHIMKELSMNHIPHETRHTVRTKLDAADANAVCIDRIMGHASSGIGANVYTHKSIEELKKTIEKISYGI